MVKLGGTATRWPVQTRVWGTNHGIAGDSANLAVFWPRPLDSWIFIAILMFKIFMLLYVAVTKNQPRVTCGSQAAVVLEISEHTQNTTDVQHPCAVVLLFLWRGLCKFRSWGKNARVLSKAVDFLSKTQRFNKPTNRVNPHRLHDAFNAFIFPPSISCYHRNPLPSKDGPRPCFCWFHGRGSSQVEWPFGFDTHPPWSRQSTTVGLHCKKVKLWSQYGRSPLSARKFRKTLKSTLCKL